MSISYNILYSSPLFGASENGDSISKTGADLVMEV